MQNETLVVTKEMDKPFKICHYLKGQNANLSIVAPHDIFFKILKHIIGFFLILIKF
jgi:hypothetical protein